MNLLVAVGLLVLGVLFIVALVFVIRSEPATKEEASVPPLEPSRPTHSTASAPLSPVGTQPIVDKSAMQIAENQPASGWYPLAHGQSYELVNELRSMRSQAQELEARFGALIEMAQRFDQAQNSRFPHEEQALDSSGPQTTH
ncbi:MAG: hypothetical protein JO215_14445 [Ktedonobacteraceae bacterium]|nr:hypothetical protein [Ktedonobacteraceae bacterium]